MKVDMPTSDQVEAMLLQLGITDAADKAPEYLEAMTPLIGALGIADQLPNNLPAVTYPRGEIYRPSDDQNPLNAWVVKSRVEGAGRGPLQGRTIALKDTVMLAGVPLSAGTSILDDYVPQLDATIVTRLLDAGAVIAGKAACEAYCISGGSHTSWTGPVHNPHRHGYSSGGSSSGSAALVAAGEVDMAIGCDQAGSIRIPASACGIVGMKPTFGLVPYTGILGMEPNIDHTGPLTINVADNALMLEVLAGKDGHDTRQQSIAVERYTDALGSDIDGLRIGVLEEGFTHPDGDPVVNQKVRLAAERFRELGAEVTDISIAAHKNAGALTFLLVQSMVETMFSTDGYGSGRRDLMAPDFLATHRRWRDRADELPVSAVILMLLAQQMENQAGYSLYAKGANAVSTLRAAYDNALNNVDLLLMPTTPKLPLPLPAADAGIKESLYASFAPLGNTQAFNYTHHPAISLPCGMADGLPIGMMLVGRHFEESTIYRAASAFESATEWKTM